MTPEQIIPLAVIVAVVPLVLLRNRRPRILRPKWMWVIPLLVVAMIGFGLWGMSYAEPGHAAFDALAWATLAVGLILGGIAGWWRGKMTTIEKATDGTLRAQASPLGLILIVVLLVSRQALRPWLEAHAASWHMNALAIQDAFMLFAVGLVVMQRAEIWIRARRIQAGGGDSHVEAAA